MRPDPVKIELGDKEFTIRPLTLGQLRDVDSFIRRGRVGSEDYNQMDQSLDILQAALKRDYPEDAAKILDLEVGMLEIGALVQKVLRVGGMIPDEAPAGELPAVQPTGTASTES